MVGAHLLLLLLVEGLAYGSIARHVQAGRDWPAWAAVALAAGLYVTVRVVLIGLEFVLARWKGDPIPAGLRAGPGALLRMYVGELGGWLLMFSLVLPFVPARRSVIDRKPGATRERRLPVLLVHGLACNRGNWFVFRRRLEHAGFTAFTVDCTPFHAPIAHYGPQLARAIDEVLAATGADRLVLVGHSMGGLIVRAYLDQSGAGKVAHVLTLGSPHAGTWMTRFALGHNVRNMDLGNAWLAGLRGRESARAPEPYTDFTCLATLHDNLVTPQGNALLPGATHITLAGVGHLSLVLSARVFGQVLPVLEQATRRPVAPR